jgi:DNA helicase-2/ATP-dependent DNA helicase PcrA
VFGIPTPAMPKTQFKLTDEQLAVIDQRGGHLQVIACAGADRTEAISRRVAALIDEGIEPNQIVAFTITERAADDGAACGACRLLEPNSADAA